MAFQSGQNCQQFSWSKPVPISWSNTYFLWSKLSFLLSKLIFLMFRPTNFLVRSQNILVIKFLGQSPFHSNAKISCSTLFHSNFMLNSVPFQQHFMVSHDFMVSDNLDLPAPDVSHAFLLTGEHRTGTPYQVTLERLIPLVHIEHDSGDGHNYSQQHSLLNLCIVEPFEFLYSIAQLVLTIFSNVCLMSVMQDSQEDRPNG